MPLTRDDVERVAAATAMRVHAKSVQVGSDTEELGLAVGRTRAGMKAIVPLIRDLASRTGIDVDEAALAAAARSASYPAPQPDRSGRPAGDRYSGQRRTGPPGGFLVPRL